jgi:hypothetical protein
MRAALILAPALLLGACRVNVEDGGRGHASKAFPVGGFDRIALGGPYDAVVTVGGTPSVRAEGDKAAIDRLEIKVEGGQLRIATTPSGGWSWGFSGRHRRATIYVTVPALAAASLEGSGDMRIDKVAGRAFEAAIGGSGDMQIGAIQVDDATLSVSGSGDLTASGKAGKATINVAGSGDVAASGFESATATVSIIGSGDVAARVTQSADVKVMGSGDVTITGNAKCTISKMGSGDVHCGG